MGMCVCVCVCADCRRHSLSGRERERERYDEDHDGDRLWRFSSRGGLTALDTVGINSALFPFSPRSVIIMSKSESESDSDCTHPLKPTAISPAIRSIFRIFPKDS